MTKKKKLMSKKFILILIGVIGIVLVSVWGYNWYFSFEQRVNRILASNVTVESRVIDYLRENEWTPIVVLAYDIGNFTPTPNTTSLEQWREKGAYYREIHESIIETLNENEFHDRGSLISSNTLTADITIIGLEKLANNPKVRKIVSDIADPPISIGEHSQ